MAQIYDTGDLELSYDAAGAVIANTTNSTLVEVTINNYAAKIVKIVLEITSDGAFDGNFYVFSETVTWDPDVDDNDGASTQAPLNTTGHMITVACAAAGVIDDTTYYVANNDTSTAKKLYIAFGNNGAGNITLKARILYESLGIGT